MQREEELVKQLTQLSLDKEAKERENKKLMEQLGKSYFDSKFYH